MLAADIVEVNIDSVGRDAIQLLECRTGLVVERGVESAFVQQTLHFLRGPGGSNHAAAAQFRQLAGHIADGTGGTGNEDDVTCFHCNKRQARPSRHAGHAQRAEVN